MILIIRFSLSYKIIKACDDAIWCNYYNKSALQQKKSKNSQNSPVLLSASFWLLLLLTKFQLVLFDTSTLVDISWNESYNNLFYTFLIVWLCLCINDKLFINVIIIAHKVYNNVIKRFATATAIFQPQIFIFYGKILLLIRFHLIINFDIKNSY